MWVESYDSLQPYIEIACPRNVYCFSCKVHVVFGKPRKILNIYVNQIIMLYFFTWLILESGLGPEAIESPGKYDNRLSH